MVRRSILLSLAGALLVAAAIPATAAKASEPSWLCSPPPEEKCWGWPPPPRPDNKWPNEPDQAAGHDYGYSCVKRNVWEATHNRAWVEPEDGYKAQFMRADGHILCGAKRPETPPGVAKEWIANPVKPVLKQPTPKIAPKRVNGHAASNGGKPGYHYVTAEHEHESRTVGGVITWFTIPKPATYPGAHSDVQFAIGAGTDGNQYTIEAGWTVEDIGWEYPEYAHFFVYATNAKYAAGHKCQNLQCPLLVMDTARQWPIGEAYFPTQQFWTQQTTWAGPSVEVEYCWTNCNANNTTEGYWLIGMSGEWFAAIPESYWGGHFKEGEYTLYGEVYDPNASPVTDMGSGQWGNARFYYPWDNMKPPGYVDPEVIANSWACTGKTNINGKVCGPEEKLGADLITGIEATNPEWYGGAVPSNRLSTYGGPGAG